MHNNGSFWKPIGTECVNSSGKLLKSTGKDFYPTFSSFSARLSYKIFFLFRSRILGLLINTLTVNYEYSRSIRDNLPLPIHIKLSKKPLIFCGTLLKCLESIWNCQCSAKKTSVIDQVFLKLLTPKYLLI